MSSAEALGGFFGLELNDFGTVYHDSAFQLNSGRNCLEFILSNSEYRHVYIPYYSCDAIIEPINKLNLTFSFYRLNQDFLPILEVDLPNDEVILYVNYYGVCQSNVKYVVESFRNCIIDNSQAFFDRPIGNIPTFYSPRKFFGVPDGGQVYFDVKEKIYYSLERDLAFDRCRHLLLRAEGQIELGYKQFKLHEEIFSSLPVRRMSVLSTLILRSSNMNDIQEKRRSNFYAIHEHLKNENVLSQFIDKAIVDGPLVYPFLRSGNSKIRKELADMSLFTAVYWPNVKNWIRNKGSIFERTLVNDLIAIPVDQRINSLDIGRLKAALTSLLYVR